MAFPFGTFVYPDLGHLLGFVDTQGMQAAHVNGEARLGPLLTELFRLLNGNLSLGSPE